MNLHPQSYLPVSGAFLPIYNYLTYYGLFMALIRDVYKVPQLCLLSGLRIRVGILPRATRTCLA